MIDNTISRDITGKDKTGTGVYEVEQVDVARHKTDFLAVNMMERVCSRANLNQAYKRVKANKGSPGIDGMEVIELGDYIRTHKEELIHSLLNGSYQPQPVKQVMIPKPGGGERQLGIPTVLDRVVQQAIHQVLEPVFDPDFSASSFGFRRKRGAHDALRQAKSYVQSGLTWVVDIDLEKFFDRVNHDKLMSKLAHRIKDKPLLRIIRRFLTSGIMQDGVVMRRHEGTPQGGPLSPLLSNILLDELDKELERRGHKFCRYADDQNIYVGSQKAGERVYASIVKFIETKLKLKVNTEKSAVALVDKRKFLGYRLSQDGRLLFAPTALGRLREKVRIITSRRRGVRFDRVINELNVFLRGWISYFKLSEWPSLLRKQDGWIRRKLRCYRLAQRKRRGSSTARLLISRGIPNKEARHIGSSGKGLWRLSHTAAVNRAFDNTWFKSCGLISLHERWTSLSND